MRRQAHPSTPAPAAHKGRGLPSSQTKDTTSRRWTKTPNQLSEAKPQAKAWRKGKNLVDRGVEEEGGGRPQLIIQGQD